MNNFSFSVGGPFAPADKTQNILPSALAGTWYPADSEKLLRMTASLADAANVNPSALDANLFIVPHAGYAYSGACAAQAYSAILNSKRHFTRVYVIAPSHRTYLKNTAVLPSADGAATPLGNIKFDTAAIKSLLSNPLFKASDSVHKNEHATQIQYPFLQYALPDGFELIPVILGETDLESSKRMAQAIAQTLDDNALVIISSDFTHYGRDFNYTPFKEDVYANVRKIDLGAYDLYRGGTPSEFKEYITANSATICGANPITLAMFLKSGDAVTTLLQYCTSADGDKDYQRFVCYLACAAESDFKAVKKVGSALSGDDKKTLLKMAREAILYTFEHSRTPNPSEFESMASAAMKTKMGAFVTLKKVSNGMLRGCIGEIEPYRELYRAVTARACDAAFRDPRFNPLGRDELKDVTIEISALTPPHPVDSWRDIVTGRHGMTVTKYGLSAVFLPQVAPEQGWNIEQTLTRLCLKAGLRPDDWKNGASFTVFEAIVFNEDEIACGE